MPVGVTTGQGLSDPRFSRTRVKVPQGTIGMWEESIDRIPPGWVICDGNNGTPNLNDEYVKVTSDSATVGDISGTYSSSDSHTHSPNGFATDYLAGSNGTSHLNTNFQSTTLSVQNEPSSVSMVFIQAIQRTELPRGLISFTKTLSGNIDPTHSICDGTGPTNTNCNNKSIKGVVSNPGSSFGSDTKSVDHSHGINAGSKDNNGQTYTQDFLTGIGSAAGSLNMLPNTKKYMIAKIAIRWGPINSVGDPILLFEGDTANIGSDWTIVDGSGVTTDISGLHLRGTTTDADVGNSVGQDLSISQSNSHSHPQSDTTQYRKNQGTTTWTHDIDPDTTSTSWSLTTDPHAINLLAIQYVGDL